MNEQRARLLRFQGFLLMLFALVQGFLIVAGVGKQEAQGRAHIEIFLTAFMVILIALTAPTLKLSERAGQVLVISILIAAWMGALHAVGVATLGATSIHVKGTAAPLAEQVLFAMGALPAPFSLAAIGLTLYGLRRV